MIAKEIDKNHDVEKVYITNANGGEVDALTIAEKQVKTSNQLY
ncbi:hypothetical protein KK423_12395 [Clostridioides difficile]|nr:hypothetical protein [Clostridioides difficile]